MRSASKHIILLIVAACMLVSSCSQDNPAYFREHLSGTWILNTYDGQTVPLNDYVVMSFENRHFSTLGDLDCYGIITMYDSVGKLCNKWDKNSMRYDLYCCDIKITGKFSGLFGYTTPISIVREYNYLSSTDSTVVLDLVVYAMDDQEISAPYSTMSMDKLVDKYAVPDSISGVWQFKTKNGEEFSDYRIQFKDDGVLNFEFRAGENDWEARSTQDYYNLYEKFVALTVHNNPVFGVEDTWGVTCCKIDSLKQNVSMILTTQTDSYKLSYISPN